MRKHHFDWLSIVSLIILIILAGCSAVPFTESTPQKEPAPVKLENNSTINETFGVYVIDVGENLTITWEYNDSRDITKNISIDQGALTYKKGGLVRVRLPDSARLHGQHTPEPGTSKLLQVENVSPDQAIVVLIYDEPENTYRAIHSVSCGGAIRGMKVLTQAEGDDQTVGVHGCG